MNMQTNSRSTIPRCFDSHVHWLATGEMGTRLNLSGMSSPDDLFNIEIQDQHWRQDWLLGYSWDQNRWLTKQFPTREQIDRRFAQHPVCFFRHDGHALWANTRALQLAGLLNEQGEATDLARSYAQPGGSIVLNEKGVPTGVLIDLAMGFVFRVLPQPDTSTIKTNLLRGMQLFNSQGFTHIRDVGGDLAQWEIAQDLAQNGDLSMAVEQYFAAEDPRHFQKNLEDACRVQSEVGNDRASLIRVKGIKMYYDGALGSEGALLSEAYLTSKQHGLALMSNSELAEYLKQTWHSGLDFAIHAIGDEAAHQILLTAKQVWRTGIKGILHIEHAQMLRPETIELMRGESVVCHMQPCHWLSDHPWLQSKLGQMMSYVFPWAALEKAGIEFDFGSDAPIEPPVLKNNFLALQQSQELAIAPIQKPFQQYHRHPDALWPDQTYSEFINWEPMRTVFKGRTIYHNPSLIDQELSV